jgi:hypothetical protein
MTYLEQCTKYFQPLDEIAEAVFSGSGISGMSHKELVMLIQLKPSLMQDLAEHEECFVC